MCAALAADAFIGEIRLFGGRNPPAGWALCNGQLLAISEYQSLYSLIGTVYGGDGVSNFALPNLRGSLAIGQGKGPGLSNDYAMGARGGRYTVNLTVANMPTHTHSMQALTATATTTDPSLGYFAQMEEPYTEYLPTSATGVTRFAPNPAMLTSVGLGTAHNNVMPTVCMSYIIALNGIYPTFS